MPIVGYNPVSSTEFGPYDGETQLSTKFSMPESGIINSIYWKSRSELGADINGRLVIYNSAIDGGSGKAAPFEVLGIGSIIIGATSQYNGITGLSIPIGAIDFWIKAVVDGGYYFDADTGDTDQAFACWGRAGTFPVINDPQTFTGNEGWEANKFLMYVEYTPDVNADTRMVITPFGLTYLGGTNTEDYPDSVLIESGMPLMYLGANVLAGISNFVFSGDVNSTPNSIQESINVISPVVTGYSSYSASVIEESINVISPVVKASALFSPSVFQLSINSINADVKGSSDVAVDSLNSVLTSISPSVKADAIFSASAFENMLNVIIPNIIGQSSYQASTIEELINVISPVTSGSSNSNVSSLSSNISTITPIVAGSSNISANNLESFLNVIIPNVVGHSKYQATAIEEILSVISPVVAGYSNFTSNTIDVQIAVIIPIVTGGGITYYGQLKYWNGATWVKAKLRVKVNGVWVKWVMRIKENGVWKLVDSE